MPLYEYQCTCGYISTEYRKIKDRDKSPKHCGKAMKKILSASQIMPDIEPYTTVAYDKEQNKPWYINSRKKHREFLKRNGYEEVGSESTIPKDALARMEEKRYIAGEHDDSVDATVGI